LEIIIKFYDIRFDDISEEYKEENKEESLLNNKKLNENLKKFITKQIWEKIFLLTEHPNFKMNLFSTYIINYLKPDHLTEKMQERANYIKQKKEELSEIKNYFNDKFGILSVKKNRESSSSVNNDITNNMLISPINSLNQNLINPINTTNNPLRINNNNNFGNQITNLLADSNYFSSVNVDYNNNYINNDYNNNLFNNANFNGLQQQPHMPEPHENHSLKGVWFSEGEMKNLKNYIKENIICTGKLRNDISNVFKSINPYDEKDELDSCNKKHFDSEYTDDIDLIEVFPENENFEDEEENYEAEKFYKKKNFGFNKNRNSQMQNNNIKNNANNKDQSGSGIYYDKERDEYLDLAELGVMEVDDDIFENFDEENIPVIKNIYKRKKGSAEKFKTNQNNRNMFLNNQNIHNSYDDSDNINNNKSAESDNDIKTQQGSFINSKNLMDTNNSTDKFSSDLHCKILFLFVIKAKIRNNL
jgi:hypothetical protein